MQGRPTTSRSTAAVRSWERQGGGRGCGEERRGRQREMKEMEEMREAAEAERLTDGVTVDGGGVRLEARVGERERAQEREREGEREGRLRMWG